MSEKSKTATVKVPEAKRENKVSQSLKPELSKSTSSPIDQILFLQRTIGNQAVQRLFKSGVIHAKLRIGQPNDIYEHEADRVAEQVMRMPGKDSVSAGEEEVQPKPLPEINGLSLQRQVEEEEEEVQTKSLSGNTVPLLLRRVDEEEEEAAQMKGSSGQTRDRGPNPDLRISNIRGGGQPLPQSVRSYFEPRFGQDFGRVSLRTDSNASESARAINARAFTVGHTISFGSNQYSPETSSGKKLLAHE